jgi:hypothetical protein
MNSKKQIEQAHALQEMFDYTIHMTVCGSGDGKKIDIHYPGCPLGLYKVDELSKPTGESEAKVNTS